MRRRTGDAEDRTIRRSWRIFGGSLSFLGLIAIVRLAVDRSAAIDWAMALLILLAAAAAIRHRFAVTAREVGRRAETESFAPILQGLSRSVSPDAIMDAIVEEIGTGTGADHIVIVRLRMDSRVLEATLVNTRTGGPSSTTLFPVSDLDVRLDRLDVGRREPVAIPINGGRSIDLPIAAGARPTGAGRGPGWSAAARPSGSSAARATGSSRPRSRRDDPALAVASRIADRARSVYGLKHTLTAPLTTDAGPIGAIVVSRRTAEGWPPSAERILTAAAVEASLALSRAYSHRETEARASTDALTGLPNRRYFDEFCALLARRRRTEDAIGILMVDIDRFKSLNDTFGHAVGDEVLRAVAGAIAGAVREDDVPARFGGEEFAVLLRNPSLGTAVEVGERVREAVARLDLSQFGPQSTSVSVGVAVAGRTDQPISEILEQADRALYDAKRAGRDRVVAA